MPEAGCRAHGRGPCLPCAAAIRKAMQSGGRREGGDPRRRIRHAPVRGDPGAAQADGRDRRSAAALARHEDLRSLRADRLRRVPRIQGLRHQGVLRQLLPAQLERDLRPARARRGGPRRPGRAVARHAGRHRRRHPDRRPREEGRRLSRRRDVPHDLWRRARRCRHHATAFVPSCPRASGDRDRGPASRALRRPAVRRRAASA